MGLACSTLSRVLDSDEDSTCVDHCEAACHAGAPERESLQKVTPDAPHTVFDISACSPHTSPAQGGGLPAPVGTCRSVQSQGDASCGADPDLHTLHNLLHLACTLLGAHSAAVAAPARASRARAPDGLALLDACADACKPCGVVAVTNPGRDGSLREDIFGLEEAHVAFYVGVELTAKDGADLGMLCVADARPLQRDGNTGAVAGSMAQLVERELQLAAAPAEALAPVRPTGACTPTPHGVRALRRSLNLNPEPARTPRRGSSGLGSRDPKPCAPAASAFAPAACEEARLLVDTRARGWAVLHANELAQRDLLQEEGQRLTCVWDLFDLGDDCMAPWERFAAALERGEDFVVHKARLRDPDGGLTCGDWDLQFRLLRPGTPCPPEAGGACGERLYWALLQWAPARTSATTMLSQYSSTCSSRRSSISKLPSMELPVFPGLELGKLLGQGSYGRVYRGAYNGKTIAVKMVENTALLRMQDGQPLEAVIMAGLAHAQVVHTIAHLMVPAGKVDSVWDSARVHEADSEQKAQLKRMAEAKNGHAWLLLEYMDRGSLQEAIKRGAFLMPPSRGPERPNIAALLTTAAEIAAGMAFLHARGIIHGDLSGSNVLLQSRASAAHGFCAKVSDFGLARNMATSRIETNSLGTVTHMPPELLADGMLSKAVDVYAFGVLLWEMYNGKRAWDGLSQAQIVYAVAIKLDSLAWEPSANAAVVALACECMASDPALRPTFAQLAKRIGDLLHRPAAQLKPARSR